MPRGRQAETSHLSIAPAGRRSPARASAGQWVLATTLFLLTFFSTTTLGSVWWVAAQTQRSTDLALWLSPHTVRVVWSDAGYLGNGLAFSIPLLLILLCHELGHYLVCRRYGLRSNPPYFLPAPFALGTLGAFIRIRSPIQDKRQLFDVGVSGPLAGFVALLPFLLFGVSRSSVTILPAADPPSIGNALLFLPGESLLMKIVAAAMHGEIGAGEILNLHPVALAAWVGLLATALNLLPLGQLDGGHILYASLGRLQRCVAWPLWISLALCGLLWPGWLIWCVVIAILGLRHPPVLEPTQSLDPRRMRLAIVAGVIFVLSFMPVPISTLWVVG